jgi:hypothetical protein
MPTKLHSMDSQRDENTANETTKRMKTGSEPGLRAVEQANVRANIGEGARMTELRTGDWVPSEVRRRRENEE